ncbi:MAG: hypothetical protein ABI658_31655 [Acidimicrobiales bacterium]
MSDDTAGSGPEVILKPDALLALHSVTEELFETLRRWFRVPSIVSLDLSDIDAVVREMSDPVMIAALAMRKLQALRLLALPGVRTSTDVVLSIVNDLDRALIQAPVMRLKLRAEETDWDAAFEQLTHEPSGQHPSRVTPHDSRDADPETERFRDLHQRLHEAAIAVLEASEGDIRYLE